MSIMRRASASCRCCQPGFHTKVKMTLAIAIKHPARTRKSHGVEVAKSRIGVSVAIERPSMDAGFKGEMPPALGAHGAFAGEELLGVVEVVGLGMLHLRL